MELYIEDTNFDKLVFTEKPLQKGEYESCTFSNCNFSNSDLTHIIFSECEFINCNLSMAKLTDTALRNVTFRDCKMLGVNFENCNKFALEITLKNCVANHCIFYKTKLKKTNFKNTQLHETDFSECDLTNSVFDNCDLTRATFSNTILENVDFRTAYNFEIDPEFNRIKKARFSNENILGLLTKYDIKIE